jgi:Phycobilisome protein
MITLLEKLVDGADGSYATKQDLRNLEHAMFSWAERKEAYTAIETNEKVIIDRAMSLIQSDKSTPTDRRMDSDTASRCRRDITLALRAYALGMLLQDEEMLKDRFLYWQKNVLRAMGLHHYQGVKFVLEAITQELPKEQAKLFEPYFNVGQEMMMSN